MTLARFDPFERLMTLRQAIDRLFDEAWIPTSRFFREEMGMAPVDVAEDEQAITVKAALPGMKPEEIEVSVAGTLLTIKGEHKAEEEAKGQNWLRREIRYGRVERTLDLPAPVDTDRAEAQFENGLLTLRLPKLEAAKPKHIPVRVKVAA